MLEGRVGNRKLAEYLGNKLTGEVIGVFSSAVYFGLGGKILLLHDESYGILPFGIALTGLSDRAKSLGLEQGMEMTLDRGVLRCGGTGFELRLRFESEAETPVDISALPIFAEKAEKLLKQNSRSALAVYGSCELAGLDKSSIDDIFAASAYNGISKLINAMNSAGDRDIEEALLLLIGLGRGLTPSLDDFISGAMFVFNYANRIWGLELPCISPMCKALEKIVPMRTNVYSGAYLLSAAAGEDFSLMRDCLENAPQSSFSSSAERLMRVGGSSGADMLSGMCFASNYILRHRQVTL